ncbi:MAG: hypothetical protein ACKVPJ_02025 [Chitinophagales bacterium]
MKKSVFTLLVIFFCLSLKGQYYQYEFKIDNIINAGDAKLATQYMIKIFDEQPAYNEETGIFTVLSETSITRTSFARKSFENGYRLTAFALVKTVAFYPGSKK